MCAAVAQRAAGGRRPADGLLAEPAQDVLGRADHVAGEFLVGLTIGPAQQVCPEVLLGIGPGEDVGRGVMGAAHIAGMAGVAAAIEFRPRFQHPPATAHPPGASRGPPPRIAAPAPPPPPTTPPIYHPPLLSSFYCCLR